MPRALIVVGHPDSSSLTHAAVAQARSTFEAAGVVVDTADLYADGFDPRLPADEIVRRYSFDPLVQRYVELVEAASYLVVAHPQWWDHPPSIVKGFVDRVFVPGVAYEYQGEEYLEKERVPLLGGMAALVLSSTNEPPPVAGNRGHALSAGRERQSERLDSAQPIAAADRADYREQDEGSLPTPLERFWKESVFDFCGIAPVRFLTLYDVRRSTFGIRKQWLESIEGEARALAEQG